MMKHPESAPSQPGLQQDSGASLSCDFGWWPYSGIPYLWWQTTPPASLKSARSFKIPPSYHFNTTERNSRTQQPWVYFMMLSLSCQKIFHYFATQKRFYHQERKPGQEGGCWCILSTWQALESPRTRAPKHARGGWSRVGHLRWEEWRHHSVLNEREPASQELDSTAPCFLAVEAVWPAICLKTLLPWRPCLVLSKSVS